MTWLLRTLHALVSRDFRMREACKRLLQDQQTLVYQLDTEATRFRNSMDHLGETLSDSGIYYELFERAATARMERNLLVEKCVSSGVPNELIEYFGSLSR